MFHPSKNHLQGVRLIHFHGQINKMCTRREIQYIEQLILYYAPAAFWNNTVLIKWCGNYRVIQKKGTFALQNVTLSHSAEHATHTG